MCTAPVNVRVNMERKLRYRLKQFAEDFSSAKLRYSGTFVEF